jgi:Thioredoxin
MQRKLAISFILGIVAGVLAAAVIGASLVGHKFVRRELLAHPELVADSPAILDRVQSVLWARKLAAEGSQRVALMGGKWRFLTHEAFTPTIGNADSPRTLLEFTDYTCIPCRASQSAVHQALGAHGDVRILVMLYPTGGALAEYAARVALAAYRQDPERFTMLHARLMEQGPALTQEAILRDVADLNFDVDQIERESQSGETRRYLQQVRMFAEDLEISGVPAFVLNDKLIIGGVDAKQLEALITPSGPAALASTPGNPPRAQNEMGNTVDRINASSLQAGLP